MRRLWPQDSEPEDLGSDSQAWCHVEQACARICPLSIPRGPAGQEARLVSPQHPQDREASEPHSTHRVGGERAGRRCECQVFIRILMTFVFWDARFEPCRGHERLALIIILIIIITVAAPQGHPPQRASELHSIHRVQERASTPPQERPCRSTVPAPEDPQGQEQRKR